jgi:hypothetical protein
LPYTNRFSLFFLRYAPRCICCGRHDRRFLDPADVGETRFRNQGAAGHGEELRGGPGQAQEELHEAALQPDETPRPRDGLLQNQRKGTS